MRSTSVGRRHVRAEIGIWSSQMAQRSLCRVLTVIGSVRDCVEVFLKEAHFDKRREKGSGILICERRNSEIERRKFNCIVY
ncbi:hypothetical protein TNIN_126271 [Trichonephila inaurata madagascariensis]|uniref:Uncharacterized protein n=1 Tax=Trichonephila inaurata madagascariensis TaxID=2747483 RepID=A0A8X6Y8J6_9ARAC|nr:hypothetical protein TNIN_126271 [Trichonephila inaurata madagascariensis]